MSAIKKRFGAVSADIALSTQTTVKAPGNAAPEVVADQGNGAPARPVRSNFEDRLASLSEAAEVNGDLLQIRKRFTTEGAISEGRVVRRHKVRDLVIHPQNPRPESGQTDLDELRVDWRTNGQKEPIHIVPFDGKWGIMEGQRRWLVAQAEGTDEIDCFEHPEMTPMEVFLFGMSIHRTRRTQTPFDEAVALKRLLDTGMNRAELMGCMAQGGLEYSEVDLSRVLSILDAHEDVLHHVRVKPAAFTKKHLYALARLSGLDPKKAIDVAQSIRYAPDDKPVSAKAVERLLEQVSADSGKRTRAKTVPTTIHSGSTELGVCKGFTNGKIEFVPKVALTPQDSQDLHAAIAGAIKAFFEQKGGNPDQG